MIVKSLDSNAVSQILEIHNKHFKDEFQADELFDNKILDQIVVCDDNNKVITYGGIRLLFEILAVTDLDRTVRERREALIRMLDAIIFIAEKKKFEQIHCFPAGDNWTNQLKNAGFKQTKYPSLYLNV